MKIPDGHTTQVVDTLSDRYPLLGLALRHHRTTRGQPLSFHDKPYLVELYTDSHRVDGWDAMKAVQVGWSELLVQLVLERAGWAGKIAAYVLPSYQLRDRFVKRRINPVLDRVEAYQERVPDQDPGSLKIKRFGQGSILFLGSNTVNDFIEFSADVLVVDEYDRCIQENLALARDRLRASPDPQLFRLGNPTMPKVGVAALFDHSDGRRWHHRCPRCGERQPMDWVVNVVEKGTDGRWRPRDTARIDGGSLRPVCRRCHRPFTREAKGGEWVAERPANTRRGYHVSRLDVLSQDLRPLVLEWGEAQGNATKLEAFYRSVLGLPYTPKGMSVDREILANCSTGNPMDHGGGDSYRSQTVVAGVDVGRVLHVSVSILEDNQETDTRMRRCVWVGTVSTFDQIHDLLVRYRVNVCVVDARPEVRKAQELRDKCVESGVCEVWLAQFTRADRVGRQDYGMALDWSRRVVSVDRTQLLDATLEDLRLDPPRKVYPEDVWSVPGWAEQMMAPKRRMRENSERYVWDEGNAEDHHRFSDAYERVAMDIHARSGSYLA